MAQPACTAHRRESDADADACRAALWAVDGQPEALLLTGAVDADEAIIQ